MKILLVAPFPPPYGGIANWSAMVSEYAKNNGDTMSVINIAPKKRSTDGRSWFDRVVISGLDMLRKNYELKCAIKAQQPDVIHMTTSGFLATIRDLLMMKTAQRYKVPVVYHLHFGGTEYIIKNKPRVWKLFAKAMRLAGVVAAIDGKTYRAIKEHAPEVNVELVPNPLDLSQLPAVNNECKKKQIVFLGWLVPTKGVRELIEAWNSIGENFPDYKLLLIGPSKPEQLAIYQASVKVDNLVFTGEMPHDKAMSVLEESKILVLPSYTEGFPYSVMEAMALKATVIATDVGAIPEMLAEDCGMVVKSRDTQDLRQALERILTDETYCNLLADNAYQKALEQYAISNVYKRYRDMWCEVSK